MVSLSAYRYCLPLLLRGTKMFGQIAFLAAPRVALIGRILACVLLILGSGRLGVGLVAWRAANGLERPTYSVVEKLTNGVELRRYEPYLIAETEIPDMGLTKGTGKGFQTVAGYIFGKNKPKSKMAMTAPVRVTTASGGEKMAMTAPVRSTSSKAGRTKVSFVIGSAYNKRTAPSPIDSSVRLKQVAPHTLAVRKFSGPPPSEYRVERERARILDALQSAGLSASNDAETLIFGYHDPFITPSFMRRNEVCIQVG